MEIDLQLQEILRYASIHKAQILGQNLVENKASQCGLYNTRHHFPCCICLRHADFNPGMQGTSLILIGKNCLVDILIVISFPDGPRSLLGQIVDTKHHILGRHCNRTAVRRFQQVIRRQQQETALRLCFHGQRKMDCHLITVKVRVKRRTHQRMQLDCLTFYQNRLKRLDAQSVQCRGTVQHYGMLLDYLFQHIPHLGVHLIH